jgi:hypothetical protein
MLVADVMGDAEAIFSSEGAQDNAYSALGRRMLIRQPLR